MKPSAASSANVVVTPGSDNNEVTVPPASFTFPLPGGAAAATATAMLKGTTAVIGFLLTPQAAWASPTLTATAGDTQVTLNWSYTRTDGEPVDPDTRFAYQQKEGSGNYSAWMVISDSDKDTRTHTVTGLNNNTQYYFKITDGVTFFGGFLPQGSNQGLSNEATATPATQVVPTAGVTVSKSRLTIREGGEGTYTVKLNAAPSANVVVTPSSDNTDVTFTPSSLIFTSSTYSAPQKVTVHAGTDPDSDNDTATMSHRVTGSGTYRSVTAESVVVTVTDSTSKLVFLPSNFNNSLVLEGVRSKACFKVP